MLPSGKISTDGVKYTVIIKMSHITLEPVVTLKLKCCHPGNKLINFEVFYILVG